MSAVTKDRVRQIAKSVATSTLGPANFNDVLPPAPTTDLDGNEAWKITIVLPSESTVTNMPPNAALDTLVQIHDELLKEGDERFPFIQYTTPEDLRRTDADE